MRIVLGLCLALVLVAATPSESSAQAVAQVITLEVAPAQIGAFMASFAKGGSIYERLEIDAEVNAWQSIVGGAFNQIVLVFRYPSLEAWAAAGTKLQSGQGQSPKWRDRIGRSILRAVQGSPYSTTT